MEPKWLICAREFQATAQTGLAYKDIYDRQCYERLQQLAADIMAESAEAQSHGGPSSWCAVREHLVP